MPPGIGGISISSKRLYDKLQKDGYDVHYYDLKFKNPKYNNKLGLIIRFFILPFYIASHKKYDVIHCHVSGVPRRVYIGLFKWLYKKACLIMTIHGDARNLIRRRAGVWALKKADRIICVQAGDSCKMPESIRHKCTDIPAFIMPDVVTEKDVPRYILDFVKNGNTPIIMACGGIVLTNEFYDLYGIQDTINLFREIEKVNMQCRLLLIVYGDISSPKQQDFMNKIKEQTAQDSNILLVTHEQFELYPLFRHVSIYVRPTKTDGDSLTIREALSMRCPVVASDKAQRPAGTCVYHTADDFLKITQKILLGKEEIVQDGVYDFYDSIRKQYEVNQ